MSTIRTLRTPDSRSSTDRMSGCSVSKFALWIKVHSLISLCRSLALLLSRSGISRIAWKIDKTVVNAHVTVEARSAAFFSLAAQCVSAGFSRDFRRDGGGRINLWKPSTISRLKESRNSLVPFITILWCSWRVRWWRRNKRNENRPRGAGRCGMRVDKEWMRKKSVPNRKECFASPLSTDRHSPVECTLNIKSTQKSSRRECVNGSETETEGRGNRDWKKRQRKENFPDLHPDIIDFSSGCPAFSAPFLCDIFFLYCRCSAVCLWFFAYFFPFRYSLHDTENIALFSVIALFRRLRAWIEKS